MFEPDMLLADDKARPLATPLVTSSDSIGATFSISALPPLMLSDLLQKRAKGK